MMRISAKVIEEEELVPPEFKWYEKIFIKIFSRSINFIILSQITELKEEMKTINSRITEKTQSNYKISQDIANELQNNMQTVSRSLKGIYDIIQQIIRLNSPF